MFANAQPKANDDVASLKDSSEHDRDLNDDEDGGERAPLSLNSK